VVRLIRRKLIHQLHAIRNAAISISHSVAEAGEYENYRKRS
jgi:hypothetical protein